MDKVWFDEIMKKLNVKLHGMVAQMGRVGCIGLGLGYRLGSTLRLKLIQYCGH